MRLKNVLIAVNDMDRAIKFYKEIFGLQVILEEKCAMTSHRYGEIKGRYVIYRGNDAMVEEVQYLNVEEYLKGL